MIFHRLIKFKYGNYFNYIFVHASSGLYVYQNLLSETFAIRLPLWSNLFMIITLFTT